MVECSQCLAEEMKEVGKWWRDGARALQWGGISDRMATQSFASSFSPSLKPIDGEWRSKKRCRLFSEQLWVELGRGVVVLWLSWSESRPIKLLKQRHTADLSLPFFPARYPPHLPFNSRCPVWALWQDWLPLYQRWHVQVCVFPNWRSPPWLGKRHLSAVVSPTQNCGAFLRTSAHTTSFYAPLHTRPHFTNLCELRVWPLVCLKMSDVGLSITLCPRCKKRMVTWKHSSTQKCPLVLFSRLTKQQTRWAICARCTWFPTLNCRGICFLTSPNGNNYTTDTYKSVLSLLTHHLNHYRGILFLKSDSKSKHSTPHKSCSFPPGQDSVVHNTHW